MYIDREKALALAIPSMTFEVERGRLRLFAKATGSTDPVYIDVDAARRAGYPDLPAPPSFLGNSIELELPDPMGWLAAVGANTSRTLHAEQGFTYHAMAFAGDNLVLHRRIKDVYLKKGGALEFVVKQTDVMRGDVLIAEVQFVIAIRHEVAP